MRLPFLIALSGVLVTALLTELPQDNLFELSTPVDDIALLDDHSLFSDDGGGLDDPTSFEEALSSSASDEFLGGLSPELAANDLQPDDTSPALKCTSSSLDGFTARTRYRRDGSLCPSTIGSSDEEMLNWVRKIQAKLRQPTPPLPPDIQSVVPFCSQPLRGVCCAGKPKYFGILVPDCIPCMSAA